MVDLSEIFPQLPYEILNTSLSFSEDGIVQSHYHLRYGRMVHRVDWKSELIMDLEAMIIVRRLFPLYWYYTATADEKYIYFYLKDYFKSFLVKQGSWVATN